MSPLLKLLLLTSYFSVICGLSNDYVWYPELDVLYKFYNSPKTWDDARIHCQKENAKLAMPRNKDEANALKKIFEINSSTKFNKSSTNDDLIFLGFHDIFAENDFITEEGFPLQYFYHVWSEGQPDNKGIENCGSMYRNGKINDHNCKDALAFVCQREQNPYTDELSNIIHINTDPAYVLEPYSGKRFKFHTNPRTWNEARVICQAEGGQLANIESKQEEDFLVNMFNKPGDKVTYVKHWRCAFIGFHDQFSEGVYVTLNGKPLESLNYVKWTVNQPDNDGGNENCGTMYESGGLNDLSCSEAVVFFCEIPPAKIDHTSIICG